MGTKVIGSAELDLAELRELLKKLENEVAAATDLKARSVLVVDAARKVGESWSESAMGPHSNLYYGDFQRPAIQQRFNVEWGLLYGMPEGWSERTVDEIERRIEKLSGVELKSFPLCSRTTT